MSIDRKKMNHRYLRSDVFGILFSACCLCMFSGIPAQARQTNNAKVVTAYSVTIKVVSAETHSIFPLDWVFALEVVKATPLSVEQTERSIKAVQHVLSQYPEAFLRQNLRTVYIAGDIIDNGVTLDGVAWSGGKTIYIGCEGETDARVESTVHHEFAHVLYENHPDALATQRWKQLSPPGFQYGKGTVAEIRAVNYSDDLETSLLQHGFVNSYAKSAIREDIACTCEELWSGDMSFWQAVDVYDPLRKKVALALAFYRTLHPEFTEAFFRGHYAPLGAPNTPISFPFGGYVFGPRIPKIPVPAGGTATYPPGGGYVQYSPPDR
jgi:hypothetical protein